MRSRMNLRARFLSTPSGWRATAPRRMLISLTADFYPRPPGGGRRNLHFHFRFRTLHFYPRPPGGGRQILMRLSQLLSEFLSTPSGWRATRTHKITEHHTVFLSTPSGWRATLPFHVSKDGRNDFYPRPPGGGRQDSPFRKALALYFYPRPPGGGRQKHF